MAPYKSVLSTRLTDWLVGCVIGFVFVKVYEWKRKREGKGEIRSKCSAGLQTPKEQWSPVSDLFYSSDLFAPPPVWVWGVEQAHSVSCPDGVRGA